MVLGGDRNTACGLFEQWKQRANAKAIEMFELVKKAEIQCFGSKSYWFHKDREVNEGICFPDLKNDEPTGEYSNNESDD
jgi:hypothetical protein